jgi:predicted DNA-binding transcriptional regulator AlpA
MTPTLLRFADLKARGIVRNWVTLRSWIDREGFPPGMMLGPNSRAWREDEVEDWLNRRPSAKPGEPMEAA